MSPMGEGRGSCGIGQTHSCYGQSTMERLLENFSLAALVLVLALCFSLSGCNERNQTDISSGPETGEVPAQPAVKIHPKNALKVIRELAPARSTQPTFTLEGEFESARRFFRALALDFEQAGMKTPDPSEDFFTYKKDMHDLAITHGLFFLIESFPISEERRELNVGLFRIETSVQTSDLLRELSFEGLDRHHYSEREKFELFDIQEVLHPIRANQLGYTERVPGHGMVILLFPDAIELMAEKIGVPIDAMRRYVAANELGHVYLNDYLLSKGFPDRLLGGYRRSVPTVTFPFPGTKPLSMVEFHEAFSDLASAKYGSLEMPSLLYFYDQIRSKDLPKVYRFAIAMQDFALNSTAQRYSASLSKDALPREDAPFPVAKLADDLRTSPEVAPLFFADYVSGFEERMIPLAEYIANAGSTEMEHGDSSKAHR